MTVSSSIERLRLTEFFLVLSSTGLAYRRCKLTWVRGDYIGVTFPKLHGRKAARRDRDQYVN